jgi:hypothetical protein
MAVELMMDFEQMSLADYDKVCAAINFPTDWPDGLIAHAAQEVDGHLRVTDVWENRAHFDDFIEESLAAAMPPGGAPPEVHEVHLYSFHSRSAAQTASSARA